LTINQINNDTVVLDDVQHFSLKQIFESGQCFRWNPGVDGGYVGVAMGRVLEAKQDGHSVAFTPCALNEFNGIWRKYFDLDTDYAVIKERVSIDDIMRKAVEFGDGMRILRQDPWECLISFIISANNRIPRIKSIIERISGRYGKPIEYKGRIYHSFPTPEALASCSADDIWQCRCGYRAPYIVQTACMVANGEADLNAIGQMDYEQAHKALMKLPGVGPKVADCVLLFGMGKGEAFPVDVWIKRVMDRLYLPGASLKEIKKWAKEAFDGLAGMAQQYLFYYIRENQR